MPDYLYHVTGNATATVQIRQQGLMPARHRTGTNEASSSGSFAVNKDEKYNEKILDTLGKVIFKAARKGFSPEELLNLKFNFTIQGVDTSMDRDIAMAKLTAEEDRLLNSVLIKPGRPTKFNLTTKDIKPKLPIYKVTHGSSDIYRYAEEYSKKYFDIEENLTSNHIYFFRKKDGADLLRDYSKYHGGISFCRMLRVKESDVEGLKNDPSEFRGVMTNFGVLPHLLEIYDLGSNPFVGSLEENEGRWKKLATA
ncbi:hypothetical protein RIN65_19680 (plasmid) [Pantoea agglomerans]|uniref:hypothetical protein n=1 Tax=Enterobacter agglomerans TaxID=549 RepID=UPI000A5906A6|nr:hypothetical protein [Pantoea agglomerans]WHU90024.1 hypothetical protein A7P62_21375 [Pantoea agglomerans pv. gypsophilae]WNN36585.1 hypothetical protein RIN65_19680 [Pantoea agglomerans]